VRKGVAVTILNDQTLKERVQKGFLIERSEEMTESYKKSLINILLVQADTELMSAPAYYMAARKAPTINTRISALAIIQDELGHAHIAYRLLEDLGQDKEHLIYGRKPNEFKNPYGFDQPLESWLELVVANALFDRAGIVLLGDAFHHTSYGPWKRALAKVDKEEFFHLRHGEVWMKRLAQAGGEVRAQLQRAVDWMFPTGAEWFGLPDTMKHHNSQLDFRLKGKTNDQLRQEWLKAVVPLCQECDLQIPAHFDQTSGTYVLDYHLPVDYDPKAKRWLFDRPISWDDAFKRWRDRGPYNEEYVSMVQGRHREFAKLFSENGATQ
jgi:ring-1,2-phenylacetyl-CoA epoxidase subunit PaaA